MALGAFQTERLVKTLSEMPLGARLAQFWGAPMPPVSSRERPRAPRERPNDVPERPQSLSGASPERLRSAPRRARALQGGPGASRGRIGVHFGGQIGHKRCIFRCFSHLCLQTSEHAAHSYRACCLHSFQSFLGMVYGLLQKIPAGIHLLLFMTTLQRGGTCAAHGIGAKLAILASKL